MVVIAGLAAAALPLRASFGLALQQFLDDFPRSRCIQDMADPQLGPDFSEWDFAQRAAEVGVADLGLNALGCQDVRVVRHNHETVGTKHLFAHKPRSRPR